MDGMQKLLVMYLSNATAQSFVQSVIKHDSILLFQSNLSMIQSKHDSIPLLFLKSLLCWLIHKVAIFSCYIDSKFDSFPCSFQLNQTFSIMRDKMLWVKIDLPANAISVMLRPRCYGSPCALFIHYDDTSNTRTKSSNTRTKSLYFDIGDSNYDNNVSEFRTLSNIASDYLLVAIRRNKRKMSADRNSAARVNFTLEVFNTGCYYWKETENTWSSNGCQVRKPKYS